jgi:tRNA threonylcarbamoyladenosine biosynthesis protein TsaB
MLRVAIDTTGRGGSVAVSRDDQVVAERVHDEAQGYAEHLFGLLDGALADAEAGRGDVDEILVVSGPGSFTGLRIGVMTAKTLAHATGWALRAAPTLGLIATAAGGPSLAVAPAGGGHVWVSAVDDAARVRPDDPVRRIALEDVRPDARALLCADPTTADALRALPDVRVLTTDSLARLLLAAAAADHPVVTREDPVAFVPEYVSPSQAERVHGVDLREELARPIRPRGWT